MQLDLLGWKTSSAATVIAPTTIVWSVVVAVRSLGAMLTCPCLSCDTRRIVLWKSSRKRTIRLIDDRIERVLVSIIMIVGKMLVLIVADVL